jgi:predicted CoA-binding protein
VAGGRHCISAEEESLVESFLNSERFAVVGASKNRSKFGNKILRCCE